jgi:hypothetical protein
LARTWSASGSTPWRKMQRKSSCKLLLVRALQGGQALQLQSQWHLQRRPRLSTDAWRLGDSMPCGCSRGWQAAASSVLMCVYMVQPLLSSFKLPMYTTQLWLQLGARFSGANEASVLVVTLQGSTSSWLLPGSSYSCCICNVHAFAQTAPTRKHHEST